MWWNEKDIIAKFKGSSKTEVALRDVLQSHIPEELFRDNELGELADGLAHAYAALYFFTEEDARDIEWLAEKFVSAMDSLVYEYRRRKMVRAIQVALLATVIIFALYLIL